MKIKLVLSLILVTSLAIAQNKDSLEVVKIFGKNKGTFVLFDQNKGTYFYYNPKRAQERFLPASTFKIPNSLIALQLKIIPDENYVIKWDGIKRSNKEWNRDHTLASAIEYSVVPYYQELARRIKREDYEKYLDAISYGNCKIGSKIDEFWLDNSLKISAQEQISFLKRFYTNKLSFDKRNVEIVKKIIPEEKHKSSLLKFKTGTGKKESGDWIGWLVGYVEKGTNVYFFAFNIEAKSFQAVSKLRNDKSRAILKALKVIE